MANDLQQILHRLSIYTEHMPADQVLAEVELIVERVSFLHSSWQDIGKNDAQYLQDIELLLGNDLSPGTLAFVELIAKANSLTLFHGELGRNMLVEAEKYFEGVAQVRVESAVQLSEQQIQSITALMKAKYSQDVRTVLTVNPELMAGVNIIEPHRNTHDLSLKLIVRERLKEFLMQQHIESQTEVRLRTDLTKPSAGVSS